MPISVADRVLAGKGVCVFTATVAGAIYARHGTTVDTRLTVIDRVSGDTASPETAGHAATLAELLALIDDKLPPRPSLSGPTAPASSSVASPATPAAKASSLLPAKGAPQPQLPIAAAEVIYGAKETAESAAAFGDRLYEPYAVQAIAIAGAQPHPTKLVQSAAMRRCARRFRPTARCFQGRWLGRACCRTRSWRRSSTPPTATITNASGPLSTRSTPSIRTCS